MDVRLINPFVTATERVFEMMAGCCVTPEPPQVIASLPARTGVVNAVITMSGGASGAVLLRFPSGVVLPVGMAFARGELSLNDAYDAIGELANMVTGSAKRALSQRLVEISIPRIVIGDVDLGEIALLHPWLRVPFSCSMGTFSLFVSIQNQHVAETQPVRSPVLSTHRLTVASSRPVRSNGQGHDEATVQPEPD